MNLFGMTSTRSSRAYTQYALTSFFKHTPFDSRCRFVLIDNDNTGELHPDFPQVEIQRNSVPLGFAENSNYFIREARKLKADLYLLNNDLIFTDGWSEALEHSDNAITSPVSNREMPYSSDVFTAKVAMELSDYLGNEAGFEKVVEVHRERNSEYRRVMIVPFFCPRIPYRVLTEVGEFDTSFGRGGAEDYDYCLRANLAGFKVEYAFKAYLLHFGGKSSWSGAETRESQLAREGLFRKVFSEKWGETLAKLCLEDAEDEAALTKGHDELVRNKDYRTLIERLKRS